MWPGGELTAGAGLSAHLPRRSRRFLRLEPMLQLRDKHRITPQLRRSAPPARTSSPAPYSPLHPFITWSYLLRSIVSPTTDLLKVLTFIWTSEHFPKGYNQRASPLVLLGQTRTSSCSSFLLSLLSLLLWPNFNEILSVIPTSDLEGSV